MIDKSRLEEVIHVMCDLGMELVKKDNFGASDFGKLKVMRHTSQFVNAGLGMVQQENAVIRLELIKKRMEQLGYGEQKAIE